MRLIPYESFTIESCDPIPVVARKLSDKLDPAWFRPPWHSSEGLAYVGIVSEVGSKLCRVLNYRNSGQPVICGRFETGTRGTIIHITMRPGWYVIAFLIFWCGIVGFAFADSLIDVINGTADGPYVVLPAVMWLAALGIIIGGFWYESPAQRDEITTLLLAPERQPPPSAISTQPPGGQKAT